MKEKKVYITADVPSLWKKFKVDVALDGQPEFFDYLEAKELNGVIAEAWLNGVVDRILADLPEVQVYIHRGAKPWWVHKDACWVCEGLSSGDEDEVRSIMAGVTFHLHELCTMLDDYGPEVVKAAVQAF